MLPVSGFYYESKNATPDNLTESVEINIPLKDCSFFADIANRMGWSKKVITKAAKKILYGS